MPQPRDDDIHSITKRQLLPTGRSLAVTNVLDRGSTPEAE